MEYCCGFFLLIWGMLSVTFGLFGFIFALCADRDLLKSWVFPRDAFLYIGLNVDSIIKILFKLSILGRVLYAPVILVLVVSPYIIAEIALVICKTIYTVWMAFCVEH